FIDPTESASQIRVRSAAVSDGYFPKPNDQKLGNGVFVPDDLLERHDSALKIVGRISDVINVAGKKVNPAEVEAQLLRFKGIQQTRAGAAILRTGWEFSVANIGFLIKP